MEKHSWALRIGNSIQVLLVKLCAGQRNIRISSYNPGLRVKPRRVGGSSLVMHVYDAVNERVDRPPALVDVVRVDMLRPQPVDSAGGLRGYELLLILVVRKQDRAGSGSRDGDAGH